MENVKGYKQKILQKIHFQFCVGNRVKRMQVGIRKRMKFFWTVFKENNDMNRSDVFVIEVFGITVFDALVLAKQKVCGLYSGLNTSLKKTVKKDFDTTLSGADVKKCFFLLFVPTYEKVV